MHYPDLSSLTAAASKVLRSGPVALIIADDEADLSGTVRHHAGLGFGHIVVFCAAEAALADDLGAQVHRVDCDTTQDAVLQTIVNAMIKALPGVWLYYCYNAEYLFYPFCEHRNVVEMLTFMQEERRDTVMTYLVDLYPQDLGAHPGGVDRDGAHFDKSGYYALARENAAGEALDRQIDVFGGLRWRFEEHIPPSRQRINRVSFFKATPGLQMLPDRNFNIEEYNTFSCPWHNNLTAAIGSFRTAKALRRNPGSRDVINTFHCPQSEPFNWQSQQLLDLGLMEPGQWF